MTLMEIVERFVVLLYDLASTKNRVNEASQQLFTQKGRDLDAIPPTQAAKHKESCVSGRSLLGTSM